MSAAVCAAAVILANPKRIYRYRQSNQIELCRTLRYVLNRYKNFIAIDVKNQMKARINQLDSIDKFHIVKETVFISKSTPKIVRRTVDNRVGEGDVAIVVEILHTCNTIITVFLMEGILNYEDTTYGAKERLSCRL